MKVSLLIPTKNEPYISSLVSEIKKELSDYNHEIIVIEKGNSIQEMKGVRLIKQETDGLSNAVIEGLQVASGDVIVILDGDGSHRATDIRRLLDKIDDYDVVIGSRFIEGGITLDKTHRNIISFLYRNFASLTLGLDVKDNMSGFSAIKRKVVDEIDLNPIGYKINLEIIYKAKKKGFGITEVPIVFLERKGGKSKTNFRIGFEILRHIIELRLGIR